MGLTKGLAMIHPALINAALRPIVVASRLKSAGHVSSSFFFCSWREGGRLTFKVRGDDVEVVDHAPIVGEDVDIAACGEEDKDVGQLCAELCNGHLCCSSTASGRTDMVFRSWPPNAAGDARAPLLICMYLCLSWMAELYREHVTFPMRLGLLGRGRGVISLHNLATVSIVEPDRQCGEVAL